MHFHATHTFKSEKNNTFSFISWKLLVFQFLSVDNEYCFTQIINGEIKYLSFVHPLASYPKRSILLEINGDTD